MHETPNIRIVEPPTTESVPAGGYLPGTCNIGPAEIAARRRGGHAAVAASLALLGGLVAIRAPAPARIVVAIPAAGAASGYLQARLHFCAGFGSRGVYNFGALGEELRVADRAARTADRRMSIRIGVASVGIGLAVGLAAVLLPIGALRRSGA